MVELETQDGQISITDNYFDFHQPYIKPDINDHNVILHKVMDDKLMEYKFATKLTDKTKSKPYQDASLKMYKSIMNARGNNEIYKKS